MSQKYGTPVDGSGGPLPSKELGTNPIGHQAYILNSFLDVRVEDGFKGSGDLGHGLFQGPFRIVAQMLDVMAGRSPKLSVPQDHQVRIDDSGVFPKLHGDTFPDLLQVIEGRGKPCLKPGLLGIDPFSRHQVPGCLGKSVPIQEVSPPDGDAG